MEALQWVKFIVGAIFLLIGLVIFGIEMIGVFRFKYVLQRQTVELFPDNVEIHM